jgi:hypothetical protein
MKDVQYINRTLDNLPDCLNICSKTIDENYIIEHIEKYHDEFFFEKRKDWEDENEYRIIILTLQDLMTDFYIDISQCIVGIIVGVDFNKVYEPCITEVCKKYSIEADRIQWSEGVPVLQAPIFVKGIHDKK